MKATLMTLLSVFMASAAFAQSKALPYTTGFDSNIEQTGWQEYRTKALSAQHWEVSPSGFSGNGISHDYNVGGNTTDTVVDWFVSPPLKLTAQSKMTLKLQTQGFSIPFPDNLQVLYCSKKQNPSLGNFVVIANLSMMQPKYQWLDTTVTIPFISDSGYVAFRYKTIGAEWSTYAIDNISITTIPVGINEQKQVKYPVRISPNPFTTTCSIMITDELMQSSPTVKLFDIAGQEIQQEFIRHHNTLEFNRSNLKSGMYFLRIMTGNTLIINEKLIITD